MLLYRTKTVLSTKNLPKENFFLLQKTLAIDNTPPMDSPKKIYGRFFEALKKAEDEYGRGFNKYLHHETGLSTSFISLLLGDKKKASQQAQIKISEAIKADYQSFFKDTNPAPTPSHEYDPSMEDISKLERENALLEKMVGLLEKDVARLEARIKELEGVADESVPGEPTRRKIG